MTRPLTPYLRYECEWGYVANTSAGEDVLILDVTGRAAPPYAVDHDFWLLDDEHVLKMIYDDEHRFVGAEHLGTHWLAMYRRARDAAVGAAEAFSSWWARHPEEHRGHNAA